MLTGVNRLKTTGRHGSQVEDAIPPTSTGAVASTQGARGGGLAHPVKAGCIRPCCAVKLRDVRDNARRGVQQWRCVHRGRKGAAPPRIFR